ncbi:MAG TPA: DUF2442 domain-containing protein [Polyangia bacterium]|jgi:hypothetical protein
MAITVTGVRQVREYVLALEFSDGSAGQVDFRGWVTGRGGLFAPFDDPEFFKQVRLDPEAGTLVWPDGVDLCPDVLHHRATGAPLPGGLRDDGAHAA